VGDGQCGHGQPTGSPEKKSNGTANKVSRDESADNASAGVHERILGALGHVSRFGTKAILRSHGPLGVLRRLGDETFCLGQLGLCGMRLLLALLMLSHDDLSFYSAEYPFNAQ
jgi:hypothetical protein